LWQRIWKEQRFTVLSTFEVGNGLLNRRRYEEVDECSRRVALDSRILRRVHRVDVIQVAEAGVALEGARAIVLGRSGIVGRPMATLLLAANATVTVAHSRLIKPAEFRAVNGVFQLH